MTWNVEFHPAFAEEYQEFSEEVQDALLSELGLLEKYGPQLNRPHVDTLNASRYANMKELRFSADGGVWRALSPSTRSAKPLCLLQAISRGEVRGNFTDS
ncbi:Phage derived protein Gp49-like [Nitrosospira multiformis]|uniref:Phage derived protein Gp49-like n=1 Tax=Nitrosospira multiformis TaxID=1231 RepID=A0A1H8PZ44_9PROT|nr:Phage derived protein Gp49-like [Nitrosospira multiformis]